MIKKVKAHMKAFCFKIVMKNLKPKIAKPLGKIELMPIRSFLLYKLINNKILCQHFDYFS